MSSWAADSCWLCPSVSRMACRIAPWYGSNRSAARRSQVPIAVPPSAIARSPPAWPPAASRRSSSPSPCGAGRPSWPSSVPAMIAKCTPSRSVSIAAIAALRASPIRSVAIEVEVSMMITSAAWACWATVSSGPVASTVTIACTSVPPTGRYLFWSTRIVNWACSLMPPPSWSPRAGRRAVPGRAGRGAARRVARSCHRLPVNGITSTVTLSRPPAWSAMPTRVRAAARGSAAASGTASASARGSG